MRRVSGPKSGNTGIQRVGIAAFIADDDFVVFLGCIEIIGQFVDDIIIGAGHRVPPLDFRLSLGGHGRCRQKEPRHTGGRHQAISCLFAHHLFLAHESHRLMSITSRLSFD